MPAALGAGALSVDALKGSIKPFDPRISEVRGQPGQIRVAAEIRDLLTGSEILASHGRCGKVQDPYSFRCQPQVMGASLDLLANAARTLTIEATVRVFGRTGVEMEALTAVSVAALTVYDMCKAVDKAMVIEGIRLEEKSGGKSGPYRRE